MEINEAIIDKLAKLSKLEFTSEEKKELQVDLRNMLQFVNKLNELDTSGVEPLLYITTNTNVLREDFVKQDFTKEEALKNASVKDESFFKVPKVIKK
jgi:aspartyl-tRNA(Asn)/glutamyl-tRNA(Gln) amidotransferase subunit C